MTVKSATGSSLKSLERAKAIPAGLITGAPISHSKALDKYIKNVGVMNKKTAHEYYLRLTGFQDFLTNSYKATLDNIITKINEGSEDPYEVLSGYVSYLQTSYNVSASTIKEPIVIGDLVKRVRAKIQG